MGVADEDYLLMTKFYDVEGLFQPEVGIIS